MRAGVSMKARWMKLGLGLGAALAIAAGCAASDDEKIVVPIVPDGGAVPFDATTPREGLCADGKPTADWPPGPYAIADRAVLPPDLTWDGPAGVVRVKDYFEPCATRSRLLVVRSSAAWCGPCIWHATHTTRLFGDARFADRLRLIDLVIADEDNMPATIPSATRFRARIDVPGGLDARLGIDVKYMMSTVLPEKSPLPEYVLVDSRTMKVRSVLANPDPDSLAGAFAVELASLDGQPTPTIPPPKLHDNLLTDDQWDLLQDMKVPAAPPADPTNEYADVPAAAALGQKLFADTGLSPSGTVACVTCHDPNNSFGDGIPQSIGVAKVDRNSPTIALASHARWQFWDGRADTLWMQALGPPENSKEIASSRLFIAQQIAARYAAEYDAVFGAKYPLPDLTGLPASGKPGDAAYDALPQAKRDEITRVYVNVGKSIAAFERTFRVLGNDIDAYAAGDTTALASAQRRRGFQAFFKVGCAQCHWGPRLSDDAFHNVGFPTGRQDGTADRGRADVLLGLASAEFVASSRWSDAPQAAKPLVFTSVPPSMVGAFKTPTLRGVTSSAPYGHGGAFKLLSDVSKHYGERAQQVAATQKAGAVEEWVPLFDKGLQTDLGVVLDELTAQRAP